MKTVIAKIDDETVRELDRLAGERSRSDLLREAIGQYIARRRIDERRAQVEAYMRSASEQRSMRELAESDMDHAADLLARTEGGN